MTQRELTFLSPVLFLFSFPFPRLFNLEFHYPRTRHHGILVSESFSALVSAQRNILPLKIP